MPAIARKLLAYHAVMPVEKRGERAVADARGELGRSDDVGDQYGGEHAIRVVCRLHAGEELLHFIENRILITNPRQMIVARQLDQARIRDVLCKIAAILDADVEIAEAMHNQCRYSNRRKHGTVVQSRIHAQ